MTPNVFSSGSIIATPSRVLKWFLVLMMLLAAASLQAEPVITSSISANTMTIGDSVRLTFSIQGAQKLRRPDQIEVPGLAINASGHARRVDLNERATITVDIMYTIEAEKAGVYTIPPVEMIADGQLLKTKPISLTVLAAPPPTEGEAKPIFAEISMPKTKAYLGETIPLELRLYIENGIRWEAEQIPSFEGEGFTKQKMPNPRQDRARRDGKEYEVLVFRTAITLGKAGKIMVGPAEMPIVVQMPSPRRNQNLSAMDRLTQDIMGRDFIAPARLQRMTVKAPEIALEVKPLPIAGRPKDFSGAIGSFKFFAAGTPGKVKVGDPITMRLIVSGRGNFDRINAPALDDPEGWHTYPATSEFKADDELGTSGIKTFEMAVIPETKKTALPVLSFSYFDSDAEKYVTLTSEASPLEVEGGSMAPSAAPSAGPAPAESKPAAPPAPAAPQPTDILGIRYDPGTPHTSFEPFYRNRIFLLAQLVVAGSFFLFLILKLWRRDEAAIHLSALRREKAALSNRLHKEGSRADFFEAAARVVQLETSLATGRPAQSIDAVSAIATRNLDRELAEGIEEIFATRAELLYAGSGVGSHDTALEPAERTRVLAILNRFEKSHGNS